MGNQDLNGARLLTEGRADYPVGRELFEGRHCTLVRLGAVVAIAVFLALGVLATFAQLLQFIKR